MEIYSSILAWKTPRTEGPGGLQYMELQTVKYYWTHIDQQQPVQVKNMSYQ